jgi:thioredoxin reductase
MYTNSDFERNAEVCCLLKKMVNSIVNLKSLHRIPQTPRKLETRALMRNMVKQIFCFNFKIENEEIKQIENEEIRIRYEIN